MYYALNEFKVPYPVSFQEFLEIYKGDGSTRVARDEFEYEGVEILVSTVFLGLDHGFAGLGYPILFETMIFGGANDQYQERYRTWDEALEGHKKAVDIAQSKEVKGVVNSKTMRDNELIAEFMGIHVRLWDKVLYYSDEDGYVDLAGDAQPYWPDKSWNQLMPVVEKINKLWMGCGGDGDLGYMCDQVILMHINESISRVHGAVVHFIKWYNQQGVVNE